MLAILKYETAASLTCLIDSTIIDTYRYALFGKSEQYNVDLARLLRVDNYLSLTSRTRYTIIESSTRQALHTGSFFFKNAV